MKKTIDELGRMTALGIVFFHPSIPTCYYLLGLARGIQLMAISISESVYEDLRAKLNDTLDEIYEGKSDPVGLLGECFNIFKFAEDDINVHPYMNEKYDRIIEVVYDMVKFVQGLIEKEKKDNFVN